MTFLDFELKEILKYDYSLSSACSMKTGGPAKYAFFPSCKDELVIIRDFLKHEGIKYMILGNCSNVLFPDSGYDGAIIFMTNMKDLIDISINDDEKCFYVSAGYSLTSLALKVSKQGYSGLEFAYGIPASVGGAVYMNAGAYGGEMGRIIESLEYVDEYGKIRNLSNTKDSKCFSYRYSVFHDNPDWIILGANIKVKHSADDPMIEAGKNMQARKDKQPLEFPSCGSTFKRPEGYYAGALIEQAGLKGKNIGGAYVSEKHAGFIVNKGGATCADVIALIEYVRECVYKNSGVMLEPEIRIIGDRS